MTTLESSHAATVRDDLDQCTTTSVTIGKHTDRILLGKMIERPYTPTIEKKKQSHQFQRASKQLSSWTHRKYRQLFDKSDTVFGQSRIIIETTDPNRIAQFKMFGLVQGTGPTGFAIQEVGGYLRKLLHQKHIGQISPDWHEKWHLARNLQMKLLALENEERNINPLDYDAKRAFAKKVASTVKSYSVKNEQLAMGILYADQSRLQTGNGEFGSRLSNIMYKIEWDWESLYPMTSISRTDQISPESLSDDQVFVYDSEQHKGIPTNDVLNTLSALYEHNISKEQGIKPPPPKTSLNAIKRLGWFKKSRELNTDIDAALPKFGSYKKKSRHRFLENLLTTVGQLTTTPLLDGIQDFTSFVTRTKNNFFRIPTGILERAKLDDVLIRDYSDTEEEADVTLDAHTPTETKPDDLEQAISPKDMSALQQALPGFIKKLAQFEKKHKTAVMLGPQHSYETASAHDNLLYKVFKLASSLPEHAHQSGLKNPTKTAALLVLAAVTMGSYFGGAAFVHFMNQLGPAGQKLQMIMAKLGGEEAVTVHQKLAHTVMLAKMESNLMQIPGSESCMNNIKKAFTEDPRMAIGALTALAGMGLLAANSFGHLSSSAHMHANQTAAHMEQFKKYALENPEKIIDAQEVQHGHSGSGHQPLSALGSLLVLPLQLIVPPIKLIANLAICAAISIWSPEKAKMMLNELSDEYTQELKYLALMAVDFTSSLLTFIHKVVTFVPSIMFQATCNILSTPFALIGNGLSALGNKLNLNFVKSAGGFFKGIAKGILNFKQAAMSIGTMLNGAIQKAINKPASLIRENLDPSSLTGRLDRQVSMISDLHKQYSQMKAYLEKQVKNHSELAPVLECYQMKCGNMQAMLSQLASLNQRYKKGLLSYKKQNGEPEISMQELNLQMKQDLSVVLADFNQNNKAFRESLEKAQEKIDTQHLGHTHEKIEQKLNIRLSEIEKLGSMLSIEPESKATAAAPPTIDRLDDKEQEGDGESEHAGPAIVPQELLTISHATQDELEKQQDTISVLDDFQDSMDDVPHHMTLGRH